MVRSTRSWSRLLSQGAAGLFVALCLASTAPRAFAAGADTPACLRYWGEVRAIAYGYNHVVHIASTCDVAYACAVTTDVNPEPTNITVPAKQEVEVNTYLGSPARVFTPHVKCTPVK